MEKHSSLLRTFVYYGRLKFYNNGPSSAVAGNTKGGKYHCTIDLLFGWFGITCMTADNVYFYLQNTLIQTSLTVGQRYIDTSPFSIPWP